MLGTGRAGWKRWWAEVRKQAGDETTNRGKRKRRTQRAVTQTNPYATGAHAELSGTQPELESRKRR